MSALRPAAEASMRRLARFRPVFHSEADMQHAFAWQLRTDEPDLRIRLEYRPDPSIREAADVWIVALNGRRIAVELKSLVRAASLDVDGESFTLLNQGAHDIRRYDVLKDIHRVERWVGAGIADDGLAIVLSNDPAYWRPSSRATIDRDFRLHDGRQITGELRWAERAGPGTTRGREAAMTLHHNYTIAWRDYSAPADQRFRSLILTPS